MKTTDDPGKPSNKRGVTAPRRHGVGRSEKSAGQTAEIAGVRLTHADKVLFSTQNATKYELAKYLRTVAAAMLAHLADRPLSLVRCPQGGGDKCFFQRHHRGGLPEAFKTVNLEERDGRAGSYLYIDDLAGLVAGAQMNVLEYHVWGARRDRPDRPERIVIDLDPAPDVGFAEVKHAALEVRDVLESAGLRSFALLTGGKGVHVVVPVRRRHGWDEVTAFARSLARALAVAAPQRYVDTASKAARAGRIYVDWRRNERGSTAIAPFSPRARRGAPVAVPVAWKELAGIASGDAYTIETLPRRIAAQKHDPWCGYFEVRQQLSAAVQRAIHAK